MTTETADDSRTERATHRYWKLLLAFQALPDTRQSQTFMEVCGYPHYENVCSNILAFYFHPKQVHGLADLLLSAFLEMVGHGNVRPYGEVSVYRELSTGNGKRIDLAIECANYSICIENKIYHYLANDLKEYSNWIDARGEGKNVIKIVLGLSPIRDPSNLKGDFRSFTYSELWENVRERIGNYVIKCDQKWLTHLIDFMETTTNLAGKNMDLEQTDEFFIEHHALIEKMVLGRDAFLSRLNARVAALTSLVGEVASDAVRIPKPWIYGKNCMVLDFVFEGSIQIAFDLYLTPKGWELQLLDRCKKQSSYLRNLIARPPMCTRIQGSIPSGNRITLQTWPIRVELEEVQKNVFEWVDLLHKTAAAKIT